jgi:hypothetical protein
MADRPFLNKILITERTSCWRISILKTMGMCEKLDSCQVLLIA